LGVPHKRKREKMFTGTNGKPHQRDNRKQKKKTNFWCLRPKTWRPLKKRQNLSGQLLGGLKLGKQPVWVFKKGGGGVEKKPTASPQLWGGFFFLRSRHQSKLGGVATKNAKKPVGNICGRRTKWGGGGVHQGGGKKEKNANEGGKKKTGWGGGVKEVGKTPPPPDHPFEKQRGGFLCFTQGGGGENQEVRAGPVVLG